MLPAIDAVPERDPAQDAPRSESHYSMTCSAANRFAATVSAGYCKTIDVTKEELAWNFGCISASQSNEQVEAVLVRELILSNNKRLYLGAQSAADRTAATADLA